MFKFKRGVSPIIAAVLLVVITIAIGATTMAFIRSLTDTSIETAQEKATRIACGTDLELEIPVVQNSYKICYHDTTGNISVLFHNKGTIDVKGFSLTILLNDSSITTDKSVGLAVDINEYVQMDIATTATIGNATTEVLQWIINPKIQGSPGKGDTVCSDVAIIRDQGEIDPCT